MSPSRRLLLAGLVTLAAPACGGAPEKRTIADPVPNVSLTERRPDVAQPEVLPPSQSDRPADRLSDPVQARPLTETDPAPIDAANTLAPAAAEPSRDAPDPPPAQTQPTAARSAPLPPCEADDDMCRIDRLGKVTLGWLREGLTRDAIVARLGEPAKAEPPWEEGATGDWVSTCAWPSAGIAIDFWSSTEDGEQKARGLRVKAPFAEKTGRGIGIGSTEAEVRAAYGDMLDPRPDGVVAGSVYGGIFFDFDESGRVVHIFVGPGAE